MDKHIDKVTLFILCAVLYVQYYLDLYVVVPLISVVIIGAFMSYTDSMKLKGVAALCYMIICALDSKFIFFLPVICYEFFCSSYQVGSVLAVFPLGIALRSLPLRACVVMILFTGLAYLIKHRTTVLQRVKSDYVAQRDATKEFAMQLESKNNELMEKQDYEINLATLNERNRIARDIHDNVGHILSNAILQTGALLATTSDDATKERLRTLKDTLSTGMDSIRSSIHDLHDESIDLYTELRRLTDPFEFCAVTLDYDIDSSPDKQIKYAMIAVVKESLSNIIRHSDATQVTVALREHPGLYQLIVRDNGSKKSDGGDGIGLRNISQRIESLGGLVNISDEDGFTVFISIPKHKEAQL